MVTESLESRKRERAGLGRLIKNLLQYSTFFLNLKTTDESG